MKVVVIYKNGTRDEYSRVRFVSTYTITVPQIVIHSNEMVPQVNINLKKVDNYYCMESEE